MNLEGNFDKEQMSLFFYPTLLCKKWEKNYVTRNFYYINDKYSYKGKSVKR